MDTDVHHGHFRSRTSSSNIFPIQSPTPLHHSLQSSTSYNDGTSLNTFATVSSGSSYPYPPAAYRVSPSADLRRSTSSRSDNSCAQPSGYVAALRKQKATVWCDRFQDPIRGYFDPSQGKRNSAGGPALTPLAAGSRTAAKIRHHGRLPLPEFTSGENHVGVGGIPLRLSATEVEGESSGDEAAARPSYHQADSSDQSSSASTRRIAASRPGQSARPRSPGRTPDSTDSLIEQQVQLASSATSLSAFAGTTAVTDDAASGRAESTGSGGVGEHVDSVGELGTTPHLASNSLFNANAARDRRVIEDLKRRGSVDERTMTLTKTGRLYIANPD